MQTEKKFQLRFRFQNLLIWIFLYIVASPFLEGVPYTEILVQLLFSVVLVSAIFAIHKQSGIRWPILALMVLTTGVIWCHVLNLFPIRDEAINFLLFFYLGLLVLAFGRYVFAAQRVDAELISAALCLYLLAGMLWGAIFMLLEGFTPGSFAGSGLDQALSFHEKTPIFCYFSFTTMTTLGYGDITPQTPAAMAFCLVEAILGQFFMAVMVARLVGVQVAQSFSRKE